jgi:hypothetical protein
MTPTAFESVGEWDTVPVVFLMDAETVAEAAPAVTLCGADMGELKACRNTCCQYGDPRGEVSSVCETGVDRGVERESNGTDTDGTACTGVKNTGDGCG